MPVVSAADLQSRLDSLKTNLSQPETEDSWEKISKGIKGVNDLCENGACDFPTVLIPALRSLSRPITNSMVSERTRLSGAAIDLISSVASGLGSSFDPLVPVFFPALLSLCSRTNKVVITRARACMTVIIESTQLPSILPLFLQSIKDKSASLRLAAAEGTLTCMNCFNPPDLEKEARARDIEAILRSTARDAQADIRLVGRKIFEAYKLLFPSRVEGFTAPLTPTMKKYLDIKITNVRSKPTAPRLTPTLEVKPTLSSSTSALSAARGRPELSLPPHARSASSSAISTGDKSRHVREATVPVKATRQVPAKAALSDMPPPQYVPIRPSKNPSHSVSVSRSTSTVDDRKRTVSTCVQPLVRTGMNTAQSNPSTGYPTRPTSSSSLHDAPRRVQLQATALPGSAQEQSTGPRRVPILPPPAKEPESRTKPQLNNVRARPEAAPTRPLRPESDTRAIATSMGSAKERAKPVPKAPGLGATASAANAGKTTVVATKAPIVPSKVARSGGVTQPTLSQLSRAKAAAEHKITVHASQKRPFGLTALAKTKPSTRSTSSSSQQGMRKAQVVRSITPAQVPLPPSPTPLDHSTTDRGSRPTSPPPTSSCPASVPLAPVDLPEENNSENPDNVAVTPEVSEGHGHPSTVVIALESILNEAEPESLQEAVSSTQQPLVDEDDNTIVGPSLINCEEPGLLTSEPSSGNPGTPYSLENILDTSAKTPISSLLSSIQRGFLFTPSSPLSPPQSYLNRCTGLNDPSIPFSLNANQEATDLTEGKHVKKPFMFGIIDDIGRSALGNVENLATGK
ncbi:Protein stu1 [Hypsizygus marmoreus]|uniref:Protein stu1 n=1 Tax=Hypsizygus marmoreus TaxID=39966 RepID=A0A369K1H5_HYPMA|nr:Protein stu1 [Hypsizygus marmoreus]